MNRCVLLAGPAGSGKTTMCRLGHHAMLAAWGHPAAAIDVDDLYANVDARWELPYDDARNAMVLTQAAHLAISLFGHGWRTVVICGNSLFDPADTAHLTTALDPSVEVFHVTLAPSLATVLRRNDRDAKVLTRDYAAHAVREHPGTVRLDTSAMTAEQGLNALARLVLATPRPG